MISIKLSHGDLHAIHQVALIKLKSTSNRAIDSHLWPISCTIDAFVEHAAKCGICLEVIQPVPRNYEPIDD